MMVGALISRPVNNRIAGVDQTMTGVMGIYRIDGRDMS